MHKILRYYISGGRKKRVRKFALANTFLSNWQDNWIKGEKKIILNTRMLKSAPELLLKKMYREAGWLSWLDRAQCS